MGKAEYVTLGITPAISSHSACTGLDPLDYPCRVCTVAQLAGTVRRLFAKMAGVEQCLSLVAADLRTPLADTFKRHGIMDVADLC